MAFLIHRALGGRTLLQEVEGDVLRIGRDTGAQLRLEDDAVALDHAVIRAVSGGWELTDRGSVTGTYADGEKVESVRLGKDTTVEIGGFRLRIQDVHPGDPLFIHVTAPERGEEAADTRSFETGILTGGPQPRPVDYAAAYSLARPGWTKGVLTLGLTAGALLAVVTLAAGGVHEAFMPGISSAHSRIAGALLADEAAPTPEAREAARRGCFACHQPWKGAGAGEGCATCHAPQTAPHAVLPASSSASHQTCASCHPEHRGGPLVRLDDGSCLDCHGDLEAVTGGSLQVAARVTSFARQHPELVVTLPGPEGPRKVSLDEAGAATADPTPLDFGHAVHKVHEKGSQTAGTIRGPQGPEALTCARCHEPDGVTGRMLPISFESHCQSCHQLGFDAAYADRQAPHGAPREVEDFLVGLYSRGGEGDSRSLRDRRLGIIQGGGRKRLPPGVDRQVADAARTLFRSSCDLCHRMDLDAVPLPTVEEPRIPGQWMPGASFSHLDHGDVGCATCHQGAEASRQTADLLLPGLEVCRQCHGEDEGAAGWGGELACSQCHDYHRGAPPAPVSTVAGL